MPPRLITINKASEPELSRVVTLERVREGPTTVAIVANEQEQAAVARRFGLQGLERLTATLQLEPLTDQREGIRATGSFDADVTQVCVVTLEAFTQSIHGSFSVDFCGQLADNGTREIELLVEDDQPEPLPSEGIDIGELVAEHLALSIDPYPRHPDAPQDPLSYETDSERKINPFAALGQLNVKL